GPSRDDCDADLHVHRLSLWNPRRFSHLRNSVAGIRQPVSDDNSCRRLRASATVEPLESLANKGHLDPGKREKAHGGHHRKFVLFLRVSGRPVTDRFSHRRTVMTSASDTLQNLRTSSDITPLRAKW